MMFHRKKLSVMLGIRTIPLSTMTFICTGPYVYSLSSGTYVVQYGTLTGVKNKCLLFFNKYPYKVIENKPGKTFLIKCLSYQLVE